MVTVLIKLCLCNLQACTQEQSIEENGITLCSSTCLKKLETVSVTGGKESRRHPISEGAAAPAPLSAAADPMALDEAHEERLSLRSKEPLRVREPASPADLKQKFEFKFKSPDTIYISY